MTYPQEKARDKLRAHAFRETYTSPTYGFVVMRRAGKHGEIRAEVEADGTINDLDPESYLRSVRNE